MATNNAVDFKRPFPAVYAYASADVPNLTGDLTVAIVPLDSLLYDDTGSFNTGTYRFTAPRAGRYLVAGQWNLENVPATAYFNGMIATTARGYAYNIDLGPLKSGVGNVVCYQYCTLVDCAVGQTLYTTIQIDGVGKTVGIIGTRQYTYLTISYIG